MNRIFTLLVYLFLYAPICVLIAYSFNSKGFPSTYEHFTFQWYIELYHSSALWNAFFVSCIVAATATCLSLGMGVSLIYFRASGARVAPFLPLFYGSIVVPETVLAISLLLFFNLLKIPLGITSLIVAHTILGLGFIVPILYLRYTSLDSRLEETSLSLGATQRQTFFRITLPLLKSTLGACGLMIFILSFDDFIFAYFCAGPKVQTLSLYLLSMIRTGISPVVNALSAFLLALSSLLVLLFFSTKSRILS